MAEQNMTVWQRLSQTFGPNSLLNQDYPTFKFDKKELLRTKSREEYEKEKLQAQQTYYLTNQWTKVENNLYSQRSKNTDKQSVINDFKYSGGDVYFIFQGEFSAF